MKVIGLVLMMIAGFMSLMMVWGANISLPIMSTLFTVGCLCEAFGAAWGNGNNGNSGNDNNNNNGGTNQ